MMRRPTCTQRRTVVCRNQPSAGNGCGLQGIQRMRISLGIDRKHKGHPPFGLSAGRCASAACPLWGSNGSRVCTGSAAGVEGTSYVFLKCAPVCNGGGLNIGGRCGNFSYCNTFLWLTSVDLCVKAMPHSSQLNGFSPVWTRLCLTSTLCVVKSI